jgi:serine/threonine protein kinase/Tol biopolymer transport system component
MDPGRWKQIRQVCHSALELAPDKRKAYLKEACAGDKSILKEVESLLAQQSEVGGVFDSPALDVAARVLAGEKESESPPDLVGRTLQHYHIVEKIGEGGMGVVYRAEDSNLSRHVAIKMLPEIFAGDPMRLARFEREAKVLASFSHPNIAAIYGLERGDGKRFLVLELVEGQTLAQRIFKGPLPVDEALGVCGQIAEGLEAAHEKGIIHRDLKPANIQIAAEGKIKILDFGLARIFHDQLPDMDQAHPPIVSDSMTRPGIVLGTASYMSPEQAKGEKVDKRSDIWAFGCVLYECLTGKQAFGGETITETIASILKSEPDWTLLPEDTPAIVRSLLRRCLQKDPGRRLHDIADARIEIGESPAADAIPMKAVPFLRRLSLLWLSLCASIILLTGVLIDRVLTRNLQSPPSPSVFTSVIKLEPGHWLDGMRSDPEGRPTRAAIAISSDGRFVIYSAIKENPNPVAIPHLYLRRMDRPGAGLIPGTEGGINPFLSPDNRWIGFWADRKLKKIPLEGSVATVLCDTRRIYGASWGRDNSILFVDEDGGGLRRISAYGGTPENITRPDPKREEYSHRLPSWLPDGRAVLFTGMRHSWDSRPWLGLLRMESGEWSVLLRDAADARYVPSGHLVFLRQGTLMAVQFDLAKLSIVGHPVALTDDVMQAFAVDSISNTGAGQYGISDTGSLVYVTGGTVPEPKNSLVWLDQMGMEQPVTDLQFPFFSPRLSPDGRKIAYVATGLEWQIWMYDLDRGTNSRLTAEGRATRPIWTPDGNRLLFAWHKSLVPNLFWLPCDGSSAMERLTGSEYSQFPGSWAPDGKSVVLVELRSNGFLDIALLDIISGRITPILNSRFNERYPELSPDGRWLAYSSDESKQDEVYVTPFPGPGMKIQVSSGGGSQPLWARSGRQLFYRRQDKVWVVDVRADNGFAVAKPRFLFEKPGYSYGGGPIRGGYDLSLDGRRFLMVKLDQRKPTPATEMILVQNWFEELKRLCPAK